MTDQPTGDFDGCNSECRKAGKHSLRWGGCEHATPPEPTVSMSVVYTDPTDGYPAIGFDTYTVPQLAELIEPALRTIKISLGPNARALLESGHTVGLSAGEYASLALAAADAIVHRHEEERPAVPVSSPPPDQTADRGAKAEALLLRFTAEAHRRKWNYDRGLDDDGRPIKSEAFDALHRLGDEMNAELHKLRAVPAAPPPTTRAAVYREVADRLTTDAHGMQPDWARIYKRDAAVKVREWAEQLDGEGRQGEPETPCGPAPDACDAEAGEPCANHERGAAHAEGEHCFCGSECSETGPAHIGGVADDCP